MRTKDYLIAGLLLIALGVCLFIITKAPRVYGTQYLNGYSLDIPKEVSQIDSMDYMSIYRDSKKKTIYLFFNPISITRRNKDSIYQAEHIMKYNPRYYLMIKGDSLVLYTIDTLNSKPINRYIGIVANTFNSPIENLITDDNE